jgi:hypothetical protein
MTLNELVKIAHETAKAKGWHDTPRSPLEIHALIHSEISEATESVRNKEPDFFYQGDKPEGWAIELVDAIIRIADYFGSCGLDLEDMVNRKLEYNTTRTYRHGGKAK